MIYVIVVALTISCGLSVFLYIKKTEQERLIALLRRKDIVITTTHHNRDSVVASYSKVIPFSEQDTYVDVRICLTCGTISAKYTNVCFDCGNTMIQYPPNHHGNLIFARWNSDVNKIELMRHPQLFKTLKEHNILKVIEGVNKC